MRLQCLLIRVSQIEPLLTGSHFPIYFSLGSPSISGPVFFSQPTQAYWVKFAFTYWTWTWLTKYLQGSKKKFHFRKYSVLVNIEPVVLWSLDILFLFSVIDSEPGKVLLVRLQEWVVSVCLHLCLCTNVYKYFGFLGIFNVMTGTSFIPTPLHKQNSRGKNI